MCVHLSGSGRVLSPDAGSRCEPRGVDWLVHGYGRGTVEATASNCGKMEWVLTRRHPSLGEFCEVHMMATRHNHTLSHPSLHLHNHSSSHPHRHNNASSSTSTFTLSNALGDSMVLQRAPASAIVWGTAEPGVNVTVRLHRTHVHATAAADGVWRISLPPRPASIEPTTLHFESNDGGRATLTDILFGDVILCSGQSNMHLGLQPHNKGIPKVINASADVADADKIANSIRLLSVGMDASCVGPRAERTDCSTPLFSLNERVPTGDSRACADWSKTSFVAPCRLSWRHATAATLSLPSSGFSGLCYLTAKRLHASLGAKVPFGLISSSWSSTPLQVWQPLNSLRDCNPHARSGGVLYNSMIAPLAAGPMALTAVLWYQGESNVGQAKYYQCAFPSMIERWRDAFNDTKLWFGFVQIAGWRYSMPTVSKQPEVLHSLAVGDLR